MDRFQEGIKAGKDSSRESMRFSRVGEVESFSSEDGKTEGRKRTNGSGGRKTWLWDFLW